MFVLKLTQDDQEKVKAIISEKGYESMTIDQLREVIRQLDKSGQLADHSLMNTREQILDFLYGWEWASLYDHEFLIGGL